MWGSSGWGRRGGGEGGGKGYGAGLGGSETGEGWRAVQWHSSPDMGCDDIECRVRVGGWGGGGLNKKWPR